jgi:hypothetical protein
LNLADCDRSQATARRLPWTASISLTNSIPSNLSTFLHNLPLPTITCNNYLLQSSFKTTAYIIKANDKMHRLLLSILLAAVFCGLSVLPYGKVWSTEPLFPSSTQSSVSTQSGFSVSTPFSISYPTSASTHYESAQHHETSQDLMPLRSIEDDDGKVGLSDTSNKIVPKQPLEIDEQFHDNDGNISDSDVSMNQTEESTMVRRAIRPKVNGLFMGVAQLNCLKTPLVCKNAGWYQIA